MDPLAPIDRTRPPIERVPRVDRERDGHPGEHDREPPPDGRGRRDEPDDAPPPDDDGAPHVDVRV